MAKPSTSYRGAEGRRKAEEELARQKALAEQRKEQGHQPFRFKVGVGETTQFIVVDDEPEYHRFEHALQDRVTKKWGTFTPCIKEFDNCPVCEAAKKDSYYALYLTVIDLTEYKSRNGDKVEFSRKLMVVKPGQQKKFYRAFAKAQKEGRTLRGALFETTRDGDLDPSIGNDLELLEFVEEDELETYVRSWKDKDGKKQTEKCAEVYDYDALFPEQTEEQLRAIVGGEPPPGSRAHEEKAIGRSRRKSRDEDEEDEKPARRRTSRDDPEDDEDEYEKPSRSDRMSSRRKASDEDEDEDEKPARRGSRRSAEPDEDEDEKPARRGGSSRRTARDEPDEDEEDEKPARRGSSSVRDRPSSSRRTSRDEPDEDEDEKPARRTPGVGRRSSR